MELTGCRLEALHEVGELALFCVRPNNGGEPVLAFVASGVATPGALRLEHEWGLAPTLGASWAAVPIELTRLEERPALLVKDDGGRPLGRLGAQLPLARVLRIGINAALALGKAHAAGLVHKDVRPSNLLVDTADHVRLTGFGLASRLSRERQEPGPPDVIAGTFAYMAPEQTGRMNRSVDARSDLYSLGATLYELLTGSPPFSATEPMEWIHCHIARRPRPPGELAANIPSAVSEIVLKLLAKMAEDRYQTASGVAADLSRCLSELEHGDQVSTFSLGAHDVPSRLRTPERLYGREPQVAALLSALQRVTSQQSFELVLVSGYSGIGKSAIVSELHKAIVPPHGLFAAGKYDQYKRDVPYATLAQAFQSLTRYILSTSGKEVAGWREAMATALGANGQLMIDLIPELEILLGKQPLVAPLPAREAQTRFQSVFRRMLSVFASAAHPLVLFLDDLQWMDPATLTLLAELSVEATVGSLLIVGAYRDNEVGSSHPLSNCLARIRGAGNHIEDIVLGPLGPESVRDLVGDALHWDAQRAAPLAQLVHDKTAGNPFFVIHFLDTLDQAGLLSFDAAAGAWTVDIERIRAKGYTDNVVELMLLKLERLPPATQEAIKHLGCLGNSAHVATLSTTGDQSVEATHAALWPAVQASLVHQAGDTYAFLHDRVQEAAYFLIPADERSRKHLRIGRALAARAAAGEPDELIFEVTNHLNRAVPLMEREERLELARYNLAAGRPAKASAAYESGLSYFLRGRELLDEICWEEHYRLAFELELNTSECEFLTNEVERAEPRLRSLWDRARGTQDLSRVAWLRVSLLTTVNQPAAALRVALDYLACVGVVWPEVPSDQDIQEEYANLIALIAQRPIASLVDLPDMTDAEAAATLEIFDAMLPAATMINKNLFDRAVIRMTNLSIERGAGPSTCLAFAYLAMALPPRFGDRQRAFRFAEVGAKLVERQGSERYRGRVLVVVGYHVVCWTEPLPRALQMLRTAHSAALEAGDVAYAGYSALSLVAYLLATSTPLEEVRAEATRLLAFTRKAQFELVTTCLVGMLAVVESLLGETPSSADEEKLEADPNLVLPACWYFIRCVQRHVLAGDIEAALPYLPKVESRMWTTSTFWDRAEYLFYLGMAQAAAGDVEAARKLQAESAELAGSCPWTFASRAALVAAELSRREGRVADAERQYDEAIACAHDNEQLAEEALALERAAGFYGARGLISLERALLLRARSVYDRWGASGKLKQLERRAGLALGSAAIGSVTRSHELDQATVIAMSQALSGEIVQQRLIERLMRMAAEHAGASRCLLLLRHGVDFWVEAEAATASTGVLVQLRSAPVTESDLPESVLRFVTRTQDSVLLDDALEHNPYASDAYMRGRRHRSLLCLPLVKLGESVGALYLENDLTSHAFTPARIALLRLLASQATISLENARLYGELRASLDEKDALLKEVHHRVKNNLQLMSSLLSLQASRIPDQSVKEMLVDSKNRIRSMALVHENLYRSGGFARISMSTHVKSLCAHLIRVYGLSARRLELRTNVGDVDLDLDRAVSAGLIINELVTNAIKHAFPAGRSGVVFVGLERRGTARCVMTVSDDGVGFLEKPELERAQSLGLQLVSDLTGQLHGAMSVSRHGGTKFTLEFDAA